MMEEVIVTHSDHTEMDTMCNNEIYKHAWSQTFTSRSLTRRARIKAIINYSYVSI